MSQCFTTLSRYLCCCLSNDVPPKELQDADHANAVHLLDMNTSQEVGNNVSQLEHAPTLAVYKSDNRGQELEHVSRPDRRAPSVKSNIGRGGFTKEKNSTSTVNQHDLGNSSEGQVSNQPVEDGHDAFQPENPESPMSQELRRAKCKSIDRPDFYFISRKELDRATSQSKILKELEWAKWGGADDNRVEIANQVWGTPFSEHTTRRTIFAVLVLMSKVEGVLDFIQENIFDNDLPFGFHDDGRLVTRGRSNQEPIRLFARWKPHERDSFDRYQWWMRSPVFRLSSSPHMEVDCFAVEDRAVIPLISEKEIPLVDEQDTSEWNSGGFSEVRKIKFHASHYNWEDFVESERDNTYFALKTINQKVGQDALQNREVKSLIRLNTRGHDHLIRLLVAYQYLERLHMVFPWADGSLKQFWNKSSPTQDLTPDYNLATWMAEQCLGLAEGLKAIHYCQIDQAEAEKNGLSPDVVHQKYGRHGDLKPENILWFKPTGHQGYGILKITDFGFADFHGSMSKTNATLFGETPTYKAPEWEIRHSVAPSYDIWCLACVYLEFVEWFLCGNDGLSAFSQKRSEEKSPNEPPWMKVLFQDTFFIRIEESSKNERRARLKKTVQNEFNLLRDHIACSDYTCDFLDYIENNLLRMTPEKRDNCDELVEKLQQMYNYCRDDPDYRSTRKQFSRQRKKTGSNLSELYQNLSEMYHKVRHSWSDHISTPERRQSVKSAQTVRETAESNRKSNQLHLSGLESGNKRDSHLSEYARDSYEAQESSSDQRNIISTPSPSSPISTSGSLRHRPKTFQPPIAEESVPTQDDQVYDNFPSTSRDFALTDDASHVPEALQDDKEQFETARHLDE